MSGFFGFIVSDGRTVQEDALNKVIQSLSKRGTNIYTKYFRKSFHANASSHKNGIDTNDIYSNESFLVNFDGRILNRRKLQSALGVNSNISDACLIFHAYQKWKKNFIEHINGHFSLVIHDYKSNEILLARDHIGSIPLYYFYDSGLLIYGTEPRFIHATNLVEKRIDANRIKAFALKSQDFYGKSYYEGIQKAQPAYLVIINDQKHYEEKYFSFKRDQSRYQLESDRDWINMFEGILKDQTLASSSGMQKVGVSLSGGLDSNAILGMLSSSKIQEIHCYYARFIDLEGEDYKNSDEDYYVRSIAKNSRVKINNVDIPDIDVINEINDSQKDKPEPDYDGTRHIQMRINARCKEDGCNIIYTGFDGDIIVSHGYEKIFNDVRKGSFNRAYQEFKKDRNLKNIESNLMQFIHRYVLQVYTPYCFKHVFKGLKRELLADQAAYFARKDLRETISYQDNKRVFDTSGSKLVELQAKIFNSPFWQHHFEMLDYDITYMGLEYRHPFMDKDLMSFCLNIPLHLKRKDGFNRYIMREAMANHVSNQIRNRVTKSNVGEYYNYSLKKNFQKMQEMLVNAPEPIKQYLDVRRIENFNHNKASRSQLISFQHLCTLVAWYNANFS